MDKDKIRKEEARKTLRQSYIDLSLTKTAVYNEKAEVYIPFEISYLVLLSQFFKNSKIVFGSETKSPRLSFFLIQSSRTGKGQIVKTMKDVCNQLTKKYLKPITWAKVTSLTDAGLIGTIDNDKHMRNIKRGLEHLDEGYVDPVVYGDLYNYDILFIEESKKILKPTAHTEELLGILQEAMDDPGHVRKKLRHITPVEYYCSSSLVFLTYYIDAIEQVLVQQGFFQRLILYMKILSIQEDRVLRNNIIQLYGQNSYSKEIYDFKIDLWCKRLAKINNTPKTICLTPGAINMLIRMNIQFHNMIDKNATGTEVEILKAFSQTLIDISIKIASISRLLRGDGAEKVFADESDIGYGNKIIRACINTIIKRLSIQTYDTSPEAFTKKKVLNYYKNFVSDKSKPPLKVEFRDYIRNSLSIGYNKADSLINKLVAENYLRYRKGKKAEKIIELVQ